MALENPFVWHELVTPDQKSSGDFFARLFGWARREVDAGPFGTYTLFQVNGSGIAGMMIRHPIPPLAAHIGIHTSQFQIRRGRLPTSCRRFSHAPESSLQARRP